MKPKPESLCPPNATTCSQCLESRKLADDAMATLREIKSKYGLSDRHVMREKNREIEKLREALRRVDGHLEIVEDYGHGPHMDNATIARGIIATAISSENARPIHQ